MDIVGVVRAEALGAAQTTSPPIIFMPIDEPKDRLFTLLAVRAYDAPPGLASSIETALRAVTGGVVVSTVTTLDSLLSRTSLAAERIATTLVSLCALAALVLSLGGVHTLMSDLVIRRRRELALRTALGANTRQLLGVLAREGLQLAATGVGIGVAIAVAAAPLLGSVVVRPRLPTLTAVAVATGTIVVLLALSSVHPWAARDTGGPARGNARRVTKDSRQQAVRRTQALPVGIARRMEGVSELGSRPSRERERGKAAPRFHSRRGSSCRRWLVPQFDWG